MNKFIAPLLLSLCLSACGVPPQNDSGNAAQSMNENRSAFVERKVATSALNMEEERKKEVNYEMDDVFLSIYPAIDQPARIEKSFVVEYGKALQIKLRIGKEALLYPEFSAQLLEKIKVVVSCGSCINPANGTLKFSIREQRSSEEIIVFDITNRNKLSQLSEEKLFLTFYQNNRQIKRLALNITILPDDKKK